MDTTLNVSSTDLGERERSTASLLKWLSHDSAVRRHCRPAPVYAPPAAGAMGSALEAISLVIGNVTALGSLAMAVDAWRRGRTGLLPATTVRISGGGTTVALDGASPRQVAEIARILGIPDVPEETGPTPRTGATATADTAEAPGAAEAADPVEALGTADTSRTAAGSGTA
ncbi:hypothetical protein [Streptomyces sp. NPDC093225]|uniref:effector-associated constant component EACC1 n=1 Tax=Streptomyces sp. NPDC093225 TaxID=3366034 RepID=UPI00382FCC5C